MELEPKYVDVTIRRWQKYTGKQAMHISGASFAELEAQRTEMKGWEVL